MASYNEETMMKVVKEIAEQCEFSENIRTTLKKPNGKAEGFMGEILLINVEDNITKRTLDLVAKISMKDKKVREVSPVDKYYKNEVQLYKSIIPALQKLQIDAKIPKPFNSTAKCYAASIIENDEYLILEDLRTSGFEMRGLRELLDHEHVKHMFERYGELHALSFGLKVLDPKKFQEVTTGLYNACAESLDRDFGQILLRMLESVQTSMRQEGYEHERLNYYVNNFFEIMNKMAHHGEEKFACILHGDCWSSNLMFKYKLENNHKKLDDIKLLDWQACTVGPPVLDLSYSLYSGASREILDNLNVYLNIYHASLAKFLSHLDLEVNSVYPFAEFKRQWKKYYHYGAIVGSLIWKIRSVEENNAIDPSKHPTDDDSTYLEDFVTTKCNNDYLIEHMKILCEHVEKIENEGI